MWNSITLASGVQIVPGSQRKRLVEALLNVLDKGGIGVEELVRVAQYDRTI